MSDASNRPNDQEALGTSEGGVTVGIICCWCAVEEGLGIWSTIVAFSDCSREELGRRLIPEAFETIGIIGRVVICQKIPDLIRISLIS